MVKLEHIRKIYDKKIIFDDFNCNILTGEFVGIKGRSGSGKSTLLNIIGLLEKCEGKIIIDDIKIDYKNKKEIRNLLKNKIGYLFQNFALIDDLTVYDNLNIVCNDLPKKERRNLMTTELEKLGLYDVLDKKVFQLSGGEQQRIALVRIILQDKDIILADEPTGSLDSENRDIVLEVLKKFNDKGKTVIIVSHDDYVIGRTSRVINLS